MPYQQKTYYLFPTAQVPPNRVQARQCLPKLLHRPHHYQSIILHSRYLSKATYLSKEMCPLKMPRPARVTMARTPLARRSRARRRAKRTIKGRSRSNTSGSTSPTYLALGPSADFCWEWELSSVGGLSVSEKNSSRKLTEQTC